MSETHQSVLPSTAFRQRINLDIQSLPKLACFKNSQIYFFWGIGLLQLFRNLLLKSDGSWISPGDGLNVSVHPLTDWKLSRAILQENTPCPGFLPVSSCVKQDSLSSCLQINPRLNIRNRARNAEKFKWVLAMHPARWSKGYFSLVRRGVRSKNSWPVRIASCPNSITSSCSLSLTISVQRSYSSSAECHILSV